MHRVKTVIRLAIFLLIAHALYRGVPPYMRYYQFKDAVHETALFSKDKPDAAVVKRVLELAAEQGVPLEREWVYVRREGDKTFIDASWAEMVQWLPGWSKPIQFDVSESAWHVTPPTTRDIR